MSLFDTFSDDDSLADDSLYDHHDHHDHRSSSSESHHPEYTLASHQGRPPSLFQPSRDHSSAHAATKKTSLAAINVPSFSAFRSQLPSVVLGRSPHPSAAAFHPQHSPRAASVSLAERPSPRLVHPTSSPRPLTLDSPLLPRGVDGTLTGSRDKSTSRDTRSAHIRTDSIDSTTSGTELSSVYTNSPPPPTAIPLYRAKHAQEPAHSHTSHPSTSTIDYSEHSSTRSSMIAVHKAPIIHMDNIEDRIEPVRRTESDASLASNASLSRPKSPIGDRLGTFFGWKSPQKAEGDSSPTTTFSERSLSPIPSPRLIKTLPVDNMDGRRASARLTPTTIDVQKANAAGGYFENPETPLLIGDNMNNVHVRELERELSHISSELANSIRREMELEDELDRLRAEYPVMPPSDLNHRRSSDYYSDSGASSTRFPISDPEAKLEQLEKQVRKVEQDKANLKVETASRLQTELGRRRDLEELVQNLEDQLDKRAKEGEERGTFEGKVEELESTLDETRRRLGQEKMTKENFEDLYSATREELEKFRNEADNLRNEVVPQLRARVEGLESEVADGQALVYENTRLQQELSNFRESNHSRFNSIAEEGTMNAARMSLTRSGSLARSSSLRRGASVKERPDVGGRPRAGSAGVVNAEGLKEIEDQRDALHKALKLLIRRYEKQQRDHERAVKDLASGKDRVEQTTPKRSAYTKEVAFLKEEVTTLRKRTEDALEQKWQYEKNLSGLKMDLDRAEQETRGLRIILQENDANASSERSFSGEHNEDEELRLSITRAESERDHARQVAEEYRQKAQSVAGGSSEELLNSAKRMEELAEQLEKQVQGNAQLRERLTVAVSKGDREQKESTRRIEEMQRRLAGMEDSVLAAQQHSETTLANHDAEVRRIEDASSPHLQRLTVSTPDAHKFGPASPLLKKSPRLGSKKLSETSLLEVSRTQMLERKVKELEGLLREAEEDMQLVVQRVNKSQMEVADLQTERDAALTQMRKLQDMIVAERERAEALMP